MAFLPSSYFNVRSDLVLVGQAVAPATTMLSVDELVYTTTLACPSSIGNCFLYHFHVLFRVFLLSFVLGLRGTSFR
jgi:hypothetical protein